MMYIKSIIDNIILEITGNCNNKSNIIQINSNNLCDIGDLCFPVNLLAWKNLLSHDINNFSGNILDSYVKRNNIHTIMYKNETVHESAFNSLILASKLWKFNIERLSLHKERVCLFLNRLCIIDTVIKLAIDNDVMYGQQSTNNMKLNLTINDDPESDITTERLRQIKNVCENILIIQGYNINNDIDVDYKYCLTTKSQGDIYDKSNRQKYICGVVKNKDSNSKETSMTYEMYIKYKINELMIMNEGRLADTGDNYEERLQAIAKAIVIFEFLSVKSSQSITMKIINDNDNTVTNNKGGAFVLYNTARITTILNKFKDKQLSDNYPELWDINKVDFQLLTLEDEWSLVYNFILGYPDMIMNSVKHVIKHEFNTHVVCSFLSHLCQKFSIYYRHCRILTQERDNLIPTMMARLYLLKALHIVVKNSLAILNIEPIPRM